MESVFFRMENINKFYHMGDEDMQVLKDVNLEIREGEFLSVLGPSGSGKSTLMNIIGCLDTATSGRYILRDHVIEDMTQGELADIRSRDVGFVFQNSQLLPRLDALSFTLENQAFVYKMKEDETLEEVRVEVGVSNGNYVEIRSGLASGEKVYAVSETKEDSLASLMTGLFGRQQFNRPNSRGNGTYSWQNRQNGSQGGNAPNMPSGGPSSGGNGGGR